MDPDPVEDTSEGVVVLEMGEDPPELLEQALFDLITRAKSNGLPDMYVGRVRELLMEYKDCFRLRLGRDGPAKFPPHRAKLKPGADPYATRARRYPPNQATFLEILFDKMTMILCNRYPRRYGLVRSSWYQNQVPKSGDVPSTSAE